MPAPRIRLGRPALALAAAGLLVAATGAGLAARSPSAPELPPRTPARLLSSMSSALARGAPISGRVSARIDLGLPVVAPGAGPLSLAGDHRLRVWRSGPWLRISDEPLAAERSLISGPQGAWAWDSRSFSATRLAPLPLLPLALTGLAGPGGLTQTLESIASDTRVGVGEPVVVAGRDAHVLVLDPRSAETLVARVEIALDARAHLPLSLEVFGRGRATPSISIAFEEVGFEPTEDSVFEFRPPPGAVSEPPEPSGPGDGDQPGFTGRVEVLGRGWASVAAIELSPGGGRDLPLPAELLPFTGPLFSADLVRSSGRAWLLLGAVTPAALERAGARFE